MAKKSKAKASAAQGVYAEELEEEFEGESQDEAVYSLEDAVTNGEFSEEAEEDTELGDHDDVSSQEVAQGGEEFESDDFGEEGPPEEVDIEADLEFADEYDESLLEMDRGDVETDERHLLDAWYGEFADESTLALIRQQPTLAQTTAEVVIGKDDRVQVTNTTAYPWRTICSLLITARDNSRWIGTGWLVGPRTLITAGHVVYMHKRGGWARSIEVIPGRNGNKRPFGSCMATSFRSVKGWTQKKKRSHDYGAIILPKSCPYGSRLGYFGYANLSYFSLLGLKVNLSGYPGDKPSGTQWWHARRIKFVTARTLVYNIDTAGGQSGSPVWRLRNGKRHAVGIHTNGSSSGNSATRITSPVFKNIKKWKNV